jgi:hypothetical protein
MLLQYVNRVFFSKILGWAVAYPVTQLPLPMVLTVAPHVRFADRIYFLCSRSSCSSWVWVFWRRRLRAADH